MHRRGGSIATLGLAKSGHERLARLLRRLVRLEADATHGYCCAVGDGVAAIFTVSALP